METRRRDDSREATNRLRSGVALRRRGEAEELEAICDLAVAYRVDEADLLDYGTEIYRDRDTRLLEKLIRPGGEGTPGVSEFLAMEVAALLRCSQTAAIERIASALNLKYRHPMLFEAVINGEVECWRGEGGVVVSGSGSDAGRDRSRPVGCRGSTAWCPAPRWGS